MNEFQPESDCRACAGIDDRTPRAVENPPGLSAVSYRVGRHADFRAALLSGLSSSRWPALGALTSRENDDFTVALCDGAAVMLDVLSFYQERLINESLLRTATERRSIHELARLIGYAPSPGVAASTWLAFTLQEAPGLPGQAPVAAPVPVGTRVQSQPGPGEAPQTFETTATIEARASWNGLRLVTSEAWRPRVGDTSLHLAGLTTGLSAGDAILIVGRERLGDAASERWDVRVLEDVETDQALGVTRVAWADGLRLPPENDPRVYALRLRASLFGYNAPDPRLMAPEGTQLSALVTGAGAAMTWLNYQVSKSHLDLDASYPRIGAGSWLVLASNEAGVGSASLPGRLSLHRVRSAALVARTDFGISGRITRVTSDATDTVDAGQFSVPRTLVLAHSERLAPARRPITAPLYGPRVVISGPFAELGAGRMLAVSGKRARIAVLGGGPAVSLSRDDGTVTSVPVGDSLPLAGMPVIELRGRVFPLPPELFALAIGRPVPLTLRVLDRDGQAGTVAISGAFVSMTPPLEADPEVSEIVTVSASPVVTREATSLPLQVDLRHVYDRGSVRVNANVAPASHGETVSETLGSGAAGVADQTFTLRQAPLTYVSAATPEGRASSLQLRVDDVLWGERRSLFGSGPNDRAFEATVDDDGRTTVRFGDGAEGARPSSGQDNIRATYRKGLGQGGNVRTGTLASLLTRPYGVSGVSNPEPAAGGQDPETMAEARENAPLTVLTLDRAVSAKDYEDFARAFAGIAKAHAVWLAVGPARGMFVTLAGIDGAAVPSSSSAFVNLRQALRQFGDAQLSLRLASYRPATFRVTVGVRVAADADPQVVTARVRQVLVETFTFARRSFGRQVSVDEIAGLVHGQAGVTSARLVHLYRPDQGATPRLEARLFARLPEPSLTVVPEPAELLTLDTGALVVEVLP